MDDIMARLAISRGNVSMNLSKLVEWGLVRRVHKRGDRRGLLRVAQRRLGDVHAGRRPAQAARDRPDSEHAAPVPRASVGGDAGRIGRQSIGFRTPPPSQRSAVLSHVDGQPVPSDSSRAIAGFAPQWNCWNRRRSDPVGFSCLGVSKVPTKGAWLTGRSANEGNQRYTSLKMIDSVFLHSLPCETRSMSLRVQHLAKEYPTRGGVLNVLRDVCLDMERGDALAIMGPSGSGKSTLLHILGTLDRPTRGDVRLEGRDPFALSERELADFRNRHVGFVFQDHHLLPQCSVLENVLIPTLVARDNRETMKTSGQGTACSRRLGRSTRPSTCRIIRRRTATRGPGAELIHRAGLIVGRRTDGQPRPPDRRIDRQTAGRSSPRGADYPHCRNAQHGVSRSVSSYARDG